MARIQRGLQALSLAPTEDDKKDKRTAAYKNLRQQMDWDVMRSPNNNLWGNSPLDQWFKLFQKVEREAEYVYALS